MVGAALALRNSVAPACGRSRRGLQAGVAALGLPDAYYHALAADYLARRDRTLRMLEKAGFGCSPPHGAYYVMADIGAFGASDDVEFSRHLVRDIGVAVVPGSSFYARPEEGRSKVRFCFCKRDQTLDEAGRRLQALRA